MKGNSWGFSVKPISDELGFLDFPDEPVACGRKCESRVSHVITWWFSGGTSGRINRISQLSCTEHAKTFADRHGLKWPAQSLEAS